MLPSRTHKQLALAKKSSAIHLLDNLISTFNKLGGADDRGKGGEFGSRKLGADCERAHLNVPKPFRSAPCMGISGDPAWAATTGSVAVAAIMTQARNTMGHGCAERCRRSAMLVGQLDVNTDPFH